MNPTIQSGLIETSAPAQNDAPRADTVLVVGPAGSGPNTPIVFDDATEAYRVYGTQDTLARDIELALLGASFGARAAGTARYGRVIGLRTRTGAPATAVLTDADDATVMTLETVEASDRANNWVVKETGTGYDVFDPTVGTSGQWSSFTVDKTGASSSVISSPSALAKALRAVYAGKLYVSMELDSVHFEISVDDDSAVVTSSTAKETVISFAGADAADMNTLKSGATTWIDGVAAYFAGDSPKEAQNAILSADNDAARFYAITAGQAISIAKGVSTTQIPHLADAKRLSVSTTKSFLNLRTTGTTNVTLAAAASRGASKVAEGYFRVRDHYIGRFDETVTATTTMPADFSARVVSTTNVTVATAPAEIDDITLVADDIVLLAGQTDPDEDGLYGFVAAASPLVKLQDAPDVTTCLIEEGTVGEDLVYGWVTDELTTVSLSRTGIVLTFAAAQGIADEGGALATAYAAVLGGAATAAMVSTDRLGTKFDGVLTMKLKGVLPNSVPVSIPLDLTGGGDGIPATLSWAAGVATLTLDSGIFTEQYGDAFNAGFAYVSFDSCIFDLTEKNNTTLLTSTTSVEYAVAGDVVTFNAPLAHELVVRPLRVTQYRLGNDLTVERTADGENVFHFLGEANQPGEGGGAVNGMQVIFGFDYAFEPNFPSITAGTWVVFTGGTSGVNASPATKVAAIEEALKTYKDADFDILVPSGVFVDDTKTTYDPVTGEARTGSVGLLQVLKTHLARVSRTGAAGIIYCAVKPMQPASATGRYTDTIKRTRFLQLTEVNSLEPERAATVIQADSYPDFFIFDAPFVTALAGRTVVTDGVAFYAGIRSAMPNDKALYQVQLPASMQPVYRYDIPDVYMPGLLADARINTWVEKRNDIRLADERTAAGLVADARGRLSPSNFQSGMSLLAAKDFIRAAVPELGNLLGPIQTGGIDATKATVETILRGVATRTVGVQGLRFDPAKDIYIYSTGGSSVGMRIRLMLQVNGELRMITLEVGTVVVTDAAATSGAIPVAG